jgi:hypothetical protein
LRQGAYDTWNALESISELGASIRYTGADTLDEPVSKTIVCHSSVTALATLLKAHIRLVISSQYTPNLYKFYTREDLQAARFLGECATIQFGCPMLITVRQGLGSLGSFGFLPTARDPDERQCECYLGIKGSSSDLLAEGASCPKYERLHFSSRYLLSGCARGDNPSQGSRDQLPYLLRGIALI